MCHNTVKASILVMFNFVTCARPGVVALLVLETAYCRNAGKDCVHKTQLGRTLPRTLCKRELRTPGCHVCSNFDIFMPIEVDL
jgi:hypothetical protein